MKRSITKAMTCFAAAVSMAAAVMMTSGAVLAQNGITCAYANDDVNYGNGANTVDGYLVTTGAQTYVTPTLTGGQSAGISSMADIVMSPVKKVLYAADSQSGDVAALEINPTNCQLTLLGNYHAANPDRFGLGLAISPDGKWLFVAGVKAAELQPFAIHNDGSLTAVRQKIALLDRPSGMAVSPDSATLVVGVPLRRGHGNYLISYAINTSNGMLTQVSMAPPKGYPVGITIDSQSKFVYVQEGNEDHIRVGLLEIGPGSTLSFIHTYNFTEGEGNISIAAVLLSSDGKYLYMTNPNTASVTTLAVNLVTGALKYVSTTSDGVPGMDFPAGLAISRNDKFLFTGDYNNNDSPNMGIFAAGKDGLLTSLGTFPLAQGESNIFPWWVIARTF
jgi:6-phosphogluconolactonase (cycloisomerase 2 family)